MGLMPRVTKSKRPSKGGGWAGEAKPKAKKAQTTAASNLVAVAGMAFACLGLLVLYFRMTALAPP